ncbi:hypothetical protein [Marisediminicola sp. LYQ134]|uniref:hypothetical protein n=1 Tax=unclassified Marisediminicola TaxID=2618316 RepID=UPI0039837E2B
MTIETSAIPEGVEPFERSPGLAADLTAVVGAVEGVEHVYDARPAVTAIVGTVVAAVVRREDSPVVVGEREGVMTVAVRIAAADSRPASATCRAVFDAVSDHLSGAFGSGLAVEITVEIGRIG